MSKSERCRWCGRNADDCERNDCLPNEVKAELVAWTVKRGVRWRAALREHWLHDGIELRYLRNAVGPSGLSFIKPPVKEKLNIYV